MMGMNHPPETTASLPSVLPIFPLESALLLPRGELPLNIFEPRYIAMVDDALRTSRMIGMVQPRSEGVAVPTLHKVGCAGRITQFAETGDGRYMLCLTGLARFRIVDELSVVTPYRQCKVTFDEFAPDLSISSSDMMDRASVISTLRSFAEANRLKIDWKSIDQTPDDALVTALSMMCPFGPNEKQALLEATSLKHRAEVLVAITEVEIAKRNGPANRIQ
jgi:Lon protease-like protein